LKDRYSQHVWVHVGRCTEPTIRVSAPPNPRHDLVCIERIPARKLACWRYTCSWSERSRRRHPSVVVPLVDGDDRSVDAGGRQYMAQHPTTVPPVASLDAPAPSITSRNLATIPQLCARAWDRRRYHVQAGVGDEWWWMAVGEGEVRTHRRCSRSIAVRHQYRPDMRKYSLITYSNPCCTWQARTHPHGDDRGKVGAEGRW
jgi:hypothetical protein